MDLRDTCRRDYVPGNKGRWWSFTQPGRITTCKGDGRLCNYIRPSFNKTVVHQEMMMRWITTLFVCLVFTGCATMPRKQAMSFDDAVRASLQTDRKYQVILTMGKDGSVSIAGRPAAKEELKAIRSVAGLPQNPPGVLIRAHQDANRSDVLAVVDELAKAGMWTIIVVSLKEEDLHNQAPEDTARKIADPQR